MVVKRISKDFEVSIVNNLHGAYYYSSPNGDFIIDMEEHGDEDYVTFGDLRALMSRSRKTLTELKLVINGVIGEEYTLEDVVKALKLDDSYNELLSLGEVKLSEVDYIDVEMVKDFVRDADAEDIAKIMRNKKSKLRYSIAEASAELYRDGELSDYNVMQKVAKKLGHDDVQGFWNDIELSNT